IMRWFCWHVPAKMSLGFLCLFLVWNIGKDDGLAENSLNLFIYFTASCVRRESKKEKQAAVLATAELPAKSVDLAAVNLTELVNGMLSTALRGTKKLFSLLSITSYSSFAFHKVSVTIYNISSLKNVDPGKFPMHHCYCLNNVTNDLADFTALLVDIIGNSTSYLTEIFKSTSILSVRQSNNSDCIFICVMTGQTGRNLSDFWEILEKSPVINYTFSSNTSSDLNSIFSSFMKLQEDSNKTVDPSAENKWMFETASIPFALNGEHNPNTRSPPWAKTVGVKGSGLPELHVDTLRPQGTAGASPTASEGLATSPALQPSPGEFSTEGGHTFYFICVKSVWGLAKSPPQDISEVEVGRPFRETHSESLLSRFIYCRSPNLTHGHFSEGTKSVGATQSTHYSFMIPATLSKPWPKTNFVLLLGCPQAILKESHVTSPPVTVVVQKINPCLMELCRFFQLCLCVGRKRYSRKEAMRYCVEYYSWFLKNASYVCERVKRIAYSHTLKQKCLKNICKSV
ncbi:HHLA1 protein, partial [Alectura lathami]|nr:HHLA1 protein [Alectura lathami]